MNPTDPNRRALIELGLIVGTVILWTVVGWVVVEWVF